MNIYKNSTSEYKINQYEYVMNLEKIPESPSILKINIPKLMPNISTGEPKFNYNKKSINSSIFVNDKECKPKVTSVLTTQNFITITPYEKESPSFPEKVNPIDNLIPRLEKFTVEIPHGDITEIYLIEKMSK